VRVNEEQVSKLLSQERRGSTAGGENKKDSGYILHRATTFNDSLLELDSELLDLEDKAAANVVRANSPMPLYRGRRLDGEPSPNL